MFNGLEFGCSGLGVLLDLGLGCGVQEFNRLQGVGFRGSRFRGPEFRV